MDKKTRRLSCWQPPRRSPVKKIEQCNCKQGKDCPGNCKNHSAELDTDKQ